MAKVVSQPESTGRRIHQQDTKRIFSWASRWIYKSQGITGKAIH